MSREHGVVGLTWMNDDALQKSFAALKIDGSIEIWGVDEDENNNNNSSDAQPSSSSRRKIQNYQNIANVTSVFVDKSNHSRAKKFLPKSTHRALAVQSLDNNLLCACNALGQVVVVKPYVEEDNCILQRFSAFSSPVVETTAFAQSNNKVAIGGRDHEIMIFDLDNTNTSNTSNNNNNNNNDNSPAPIWKGKNLPPNRQTLLAHPVWPTAACFLEPNILAVGTAYHQVRIYDTRIPTEAGSVPRRRPIACSPFESSYLEYRVTALCGMSPQQQQPHGLIVGDAAGYIHALDMRKLNSQPSSSSSSCADTGRFVGPAGSVRQLAVHSTLPRLVAVGLDRMLRIYDTQTRIQLETVYLKQRLNCVLISEEEGDDNNDQDMDQEDDVRDYVETESEKEDDDPEDDIDDVLEQIDEVQDLEESNSSSSGNDSSTSDDDDDDDQLRSSRKRGRSGEDYSSNEST
jgi:ribosome biogenesis protein NSA1